MAKKEKDLEYYLLPGDLPPPNSHAIYEAAYSTWSQVWAQTLKEVDGTERLPSDNFTRQNEIGCLMLGSRCVALSLFRFDNFSLTTAPHDSYFEHWPRPCVERLLKDGPYIIIASHLTVHPDFRGPFASGTKLKDIIVQLCVKNLLDSGYDAMTGAMRCNRAANRAALEAHATLLQPAVMMHGLETDVVAWYRKALLSQRTKLHPLTDTLWENRRDFTQSSGNHLKIA